MNEFLFGTLNEESGDELRRIIKIKAKDTKEIAIVLANRTELIASEFGTIKERTIIISLEYQTNKVELIQI